MRWANLAISFWRFSASPARDSLRASEGWMRPRQREAAKSDDLFRARLEQIIDMKQVARPHLYPDPGKRSSRKQSEQSWR
jgi:hypothetical protein